jgi:AraC-like DNA-binding protein
LDEAFHTIRISTDSIAKKHRVEVAREIFGRQILRLELKESGDTPFKADLKLQALHGLRIVTGPFEAARISRSRSLLSDGNDDIFLTANHTGPFGVSQRGTEFMLGTCESVFSSCSDVIEFERPSGRAIGLRVPRSALAASVTNIDDRINRLIPPDDEVMILLRGYLRVFEDGNTPSPAFLKMAATHIQDLVALSLGARRDFAEVARERGFSAARLRAIKASIVKDLTRHDLNIATIAARHRVTPRHVQRLFETEGLTFSQFVLGRRLAHAYAALTDPEQMHKNVGTIIFDSGFGDVSYFNRSFRRRYGSTPSEVRHEGLLGLANSA